MSEKIDYTEVMIRMKMDVDYIADEAYKKGYTDGNAVYDKGCDGCEYAGKVVTGPPCISCCNSYKNRWTAKEKDDEIKVGDVVERYVNGKFYSTGIFLGEDGGYWNCLFWTGAVFNTFTYPKNQFKKTGIHLGIDKIMEEMRNE